jgi:tripartite-type tricarboxylate transporter receptor subunit TctC
LPTVTASGVPGFEAIAMAGVFAPAKTPAAIINRLNQEIVRFLKTPEMKERFFNDDAEVVASSPEQLAATVKSEIAKWGKVIKDAGIRAE